MRNVSFVIPAYNSQSTIQQCLLSILSQTKLERIFEILVVDSSEQKNIQAQIGTVVHEKIRCVQLLERAMPARARNAGAQRASGDILCFIDSDTYLEPSWLEKVLGAFEEGKRVGCGSVSIAQHQHANNVCLAQYYLQLNEFMSSGQVRPKKFVPGCNIFCERMLFESIGGFPEIRAAEDVLFCLKLSGKEQIWLVPSAKAYHIFRENRQGFLGNQKLLGEYILHYRRETFQQWYYKGLAPALFLPIFLVIKVTRIEWRIFRAGAHHIQAHIKSWPWFFWGMVAWSQGFVKGCRQQAPTRP